MLALLTLLAESASCLLHKMSVASAIFQIAQEGDHLTRSRFPTNRNFVHGGPTGRAAQVHFAPGKRKGIEMATSDMKPSKKHFVEIPTDISEMSDAQIKEWAEKVCNLLIPVLKAEGSKEENGDNV